MTALRNSVATLDLAAGDLLHATPTVVPRSRLAGFGPNWFASVMGTGVVANAAVLLPIHARLLSVAAEAIWVLAAGLLVALLATAVAHLVRHRDVALGHHRNLAMAPFYGTMAMALLTVGSGALLAGRPLLGPHVAVLLDVCLWVTGTAASLLCVVALPYLMFTVHRPGLADVHATWLLPVVPPVVAASAGAGLISRVAAGQMRLSLELICGACLGISVCCAAVMIVLLWARLALHGVGEARMVPSLWLVLGPVGSAITAGCLIAHASGDRALMTVALALAVPAWGFAMIWLALAAAITVRTARRHLPFSLGWWSFTFPVGTLATGTCELALHTRAALFQGAAVALFALLVCAWLTVASRTAAAGFHSSPGTAAFRRRAARRR